MVWIHFVGAKFGLVIKLNWNGFDLILCFEVALMNVFELGPVVRICWRCPSFV
jgi:hypothetical protein